VCITTNQPDTKCKRNPKPKPIAPLLNSMHISRNQQPPTSQCPPTYPEKFVQNNVIVPFLITLRCHSAVMERMLELIE